MGSVERMLVPRILFQKGEWHTCRGRRPPAWCLTGVVPYEACPPLVGTLRGGILVHSKDAAGWKWADLPALLMLLAVGAVQVVWEGVTCSCTLCLQCGESASVALSARLLCFCQLVYGGVVCVF